MVEDGIVFLIGDLTERLDAKLGSAQLQLEALADPIGNRSSVEGPSSIRELKCKGVLDQPIEPSLATRERPAGSPGERPLEGSQLVSLTGGRDEQADQQSSKQRPGSVEGDQGLVRASENECREGEPDRYASRYDRRPRPASDWTVMRLSAWLHSRRERNQRTDEHSRQSC